MYTYSNTQIFTQSDVEKIIDNICQLLGSETSWDYHVTELKN